MKRSVLEGGLAFFGGPWTVESNQIKRSGVRVLPPDFRFLGNSMDAESSLTASPMAASATYRNTTTSTGEPPVISVENGSITGAVTWDSPLTYVVAAGVEIPVDASLTLGAGIVVKGQLTANSYQSFPSYFQVNGALLARGTAESPVALTTRNDASVVPTPRSRPRNG